MCHNRASDAGQPAPQTTEEWLLSKGWTHAKIPRYWIDPKTGYMADLRAARLFQESRDNEEARSKKL